MSRDLGAVIGASEHPHLRHRIARGIGADLREGVPLRQRLAGYPGEDVAHVGRELLRPLVGHRMQRVRREPVRARRPSQPEIDAPRRQRVENAELLGDLERRVMRQHDPGAADADALGLHRQRRDQDFRRGAEDARMVVVFGHPETVIAQRLAMRGERDGIAYCLTVRPTGGGDRLVQNRQAKHSDPPRPPCFCGASGAL